MASTRPASSNPVALVLVLLVALGAYARLRGRSAGGGAPASGAAPAICVPGDSECTSPDPSASMQSSVPSGPRVSAGDFCINVGYLCADLATSESVRLQRWRDFHGTVVVNVPLPDFEERGAAREMQRAVVTGLRAWNNQPFPIQPVISDEGEYHFAVRWTRSLGGSQLGVARTTWSAAEGLGVVEIEMATRDPFDPARVIDSRQLRLTAAHEMGHALGLPHSDKERDVMYPTNTATSMTANDYRSVEVLYQTEDGTTIVR